MDDSQDTTTTMKTETTTEGCPSWEPWGSCWPTTCLRKRKRSDSLPQCTPFTERDLCEKCTPPISPGYLNLKFIVFCKDNQPISVDYARFDSRGASWNR